MIARLLISPSLETRAEQINKTLVSHLSSGNGSLDFKKHPDLLYFPMDSKLGIEQARKIKGHLSLKPYQAKGRVVVLEEASNLTIEAQNALLKTLEEPPKEALLILGANSDAKLLPTILSRCQITRFQPLGFKLNKSGYTPDVEKLLTSTIEERFEYIEKLKDKEEFLHILIDYLHQDLRSHLSGGKLDFLNQLLSAEEWATQNVNIRAILEYLMLKMPFK